MPDVRRWTDASGDAPRELAELLSAGRARLGAGSEVAELARRLSAVLGPASGLPGGDAPAAPSVSPEPAPAPLGSDLLPAAGGAVARGALQGRGIVRLASWAIGGVGAGAALWLVVGSLSSAPSAPPPSPTGPELDPSAHDVTSVPPPPPSIPAPVTHDVADAAPAADALPTPAAERPSAARRRARAPRAAIAPKPNEAALLQKAQSALQRDPAEALALTRRHQASFPQGVLTQEREVIAIEALERLGRHDAAKKRASAFERRYRGSVHQPRLSGGSDTPAPSRGGLDTPE